MAVVIGIVIALLVAGFVVLYASVVSGAEPGQSPLAAFRAGWAARKEPREEVEAEPVDVSLVEFLRANVDEGSGYVQPEDLTDSLHRARERAVELIPGRRRA